MSDTSIWGFGRPLATQGGIRAGTKRGKFGESWWGRRWIEVLESFDVGGRLERGRAYARKGQVISLEMSPGRVEAKVQGSLRTPYEVTIQLVQLSPPQVNAVIEQLSSRALFAAKLLVGQMPKDVEQAFEAAGTSLFPQKAREVATRCSCPDASNPCKHIAAVHYLLGEAFDADPFVLFELRGVAEGVVRTAIGATETATGDSARPDAASSGTSTSVANEPLPTDLEKFWGPAPPSLDLNESSGEPTAVLRRLGPFPLWRGHQPLEEALTPSYRAAAEREDSN